MNLKTVFDCSLCRNTNLLYRNRPIHVAREGGLDETVGPTPNLAMKEKK